MPSTPPTIHQELFVVRSLITMLAAAGIFILVDLYFELVTRIGDMHAVVIGDGELLAPEPPSA